MPKRIVKELDESIQYNGKDICFKIIQSKRKTVSIEVHPNGAVKVRAPLRSNIKNIKKKVLNTASWIEGKKEYYKLNPQKTPLDKKPKYQEGDFFSFLGKSYKLKIINDLTSKVFLDKNNLEIIVSMPIIKTIKVKNLLDKWYKKEAEKIFYERFKYCLPLAKKAGIKFSGEITFRKMSRRWGSCSSNGDIKLNYELVKTDIEAIDYVIIHELCHLIEFNHSPKFYKLMAKIMPDWKVRKNRLNSTYLNYEE